MVQVTEQPPGAGTRVLLSGNEAIARGAYEAGVRVAAGYPGTPATEVIEALARYPEVWVQWSTNEKVAVEVVIGASFAGARALAAMKHVGLNVAADPLLTFCYMPTNGGTVIVSADDPGMHSSQNEQDNRQYGRMARTPVLMPSDSAEARDFTRAAFDLSERFATPVILRSTTRLSHGRSPVTLGPRQEGPKPLRFERRPPDFVMLPAHARRRHPVVEERLDALRAYAEDCPLNRVEWRSTDLGFITGGVAYQYVKEAFPDASVLKLGLAYPIPRELIRRFAAGVRQLFVVEEGDPFWEELILAQGTGVLGQGVAGPQVFPRIGELSVGTVRHAAAHFLHRTVTTSTVAAIPAGSPPPPPTTPEPTSGAAPSPAPEPVGSAAELPGRPPVLCAGCPHRGVFYVLAKYHLITTGDIGCYTLGAAPPFHSIDTCTCMGSSIGHALGLEKALGPDFSRRAVAVIGDSTFVHSGITPLIDMVYNRGTGTVIILDNGTTAMTGHQGHPASGWDARHQPAPRLDLEALCRACGVNDVGVVDAYDLKAVEKAVKAALARPEPSVIIARRACVLLPGAAAPPIRFLPEKCIDCTACFRIGCPALEKDTGRGGKRPRLNEGLCTGCLMCVQLCKPGALVPPEEA
ncbi:MAG: indolepyruvate ferredoxin oxidoreductase subunit alpha [Bacillota bacterium]|nr:indolepyruvate ferredoxin oxidoreductase subunit alpha [Bacillota bacterium]